MPMNPRLLRPLAPRSAPAPAFTPASLANLALWLDASDATTLTLNGSNVSAWQDKSSQQLSFTQGTANSQPARLSAELGGKSVISFDGQDDTLGSSPVFTALPCSICALVRFGENQEIGGFYSQDGSQLVFYRFGNSYPPGNIRLYNGADLETSAQVPQTQWTVLTAVADGADSKIYFGTALEVSGDSGSTAPDGNSHLAKWSDGSQYQQCEIAEMVGYSRAIDSTEVASLVSYLSSKWGLA